MSKESVPEGESTIRLLRRFREGDQAALEELYGRYLLPLRKFASGQLPPWARDLMETDDLVQETLLKTFRNLGHFEPVAEGALGHYLRRGIKNSLNDEIRRIRRRPVNDGTTGGIADQGPSALEEVIGRETHELYERALSSLTPSDRELIFMRMELNLPYSQIALEVGRPSAEAARMAVSRAIKKLAKEMANGSS